MKMISAFLIVLTFSVRILAQDSWMNDAAKRIEHHRKNDVVITVTQNGKPIKGVTVNVDLVRHEFLFGCNLFFMWQELDKPDSAADLEVYQNKFKEVFNLALLPFY